LAFNLSICKATSQFRSTKMYLNINNFNNPSITMKTPNGGLNCRCLFIDTCHLVKDLDSLVKSCKTSLLLPSLLLTERIKWKSMNLINTKKPINLLLVAYWGTGVRVTRELTKLGKTRTNSQLSKQISNHSRF
jgi:hypothetical protein